MNTLNELNPLFISNWVIIPLMVWSLFWKGVSLWIAVKRENKKWFVAILILNTFGILEIIYIFFVAKKKWADVKEIFGKKSIPVVEKTEE